MAGQGNNSFDDMDDFEDDFGTSSASNTKKPTQQSSSAFEVDDDFDDADVLDAFPDPSNDGFGNGSPVDSFQDDDFEEDFDEPKKPQAQKGKQSKVEPENDFEDSFEEDSLEEDSFDEEFNEDESVDEEEVEEEVPVKNKKGKLVAKKSGTKTDGEKKKINAGQLGFYGVAAVFLAGIGYVGYSTVVPGLLGSEDVPQQTGFDFASTAPAGQAPTGPGVPTAPGQAAPIAPVGQDPNVGGLAPLPQPDQKLVQMPGQAVPNVTDPRPGLDATTNLTGVGLGGDTTAPTLNPQPLAGLGETQPDSTLMPLAPSEVAQTSVQQDELVDVKKAIEDLNLGMGALLDKMSGLDETYVSKSDLEKAIQDVVKTAIEADSGADETLKAIESAMTEIKATNSKIDEISGSVGLLSTRVDGMSGGVSAANSKIAEMEAKLTEYSAKLAALEAQVNPPKPAEEPKAEEKKTEDKPVASAPSKPKTSGKPKTTPKPSNSGNKKVVGANVDVPKKPAIVKGYRLKGVSNDYAWIESSNGLMRVAIGQTLDGVGEVKSIDRADGNYVLVTSSGLITP